MKVSEMLCAICGGAATCVGRYDTDIADPACDVCCGHGNEDGHCIRCTEEDPCIACGREDGSPCEAVALLLDVDQYTASGDEPQERTPS